MHKWNWILLAVIYVCTLVVTAPASILGRVAAQASNGRVELANTRGTIWRGSANPVLHQRSGGLVTLSTLHWNAVLPALLTGKLHVQLNWDDEAQTAPMDISVSARQIELRQAHIPLPAILLDEVSDFLKPAQLRGQVVLRSDSMLIDKQGIQGAATADWLNASSLLSNIAPLGNYHFTFSSSSSGVDITLNTVSGALILNGQGHLAPSSGLDFRGTAEAEKGKEDALRELLGHLGPEQRPGVNTFTLLPSSPR